MYTPQVIEHYENPRNVGTIADADGTATIGSAANGEMLKLTLKVVNNVIVGAKFPSLRVPNCHRECFCPYRNCHGNEDSRSTPNYRSTAVRGIRWTATGQTTVRRRR